MPHDAYAAPIICSGVSGLSDDYIALLRSRGTRPVPAATQFNPWVEYAPKPPKPEPKPKRVKAVKPPQIHYPREIVCACGKPFSQRNSTQVVCPVCQAEKRRARDRRKSHNKAKGEIVVRCIDCQQDFAAARRTLQRCPACQVHHRTEDRRAHQRKPAVMYACSECGTPTPGTAEQVRHTCSAACMQKRGIRLKKERKAGVV